MWNFTASLKGDPRLIFPPLPRGIESFLPLETPNERQKRFLQGIDSKQMEVIHDTDDDGANGGVWVIHHLSGRIAFVDDQDGLSHSGVH